MGRENRPGRWRGGQLAVRREKPDRSLVRHAGGDAGPSARRRAGWVPRAEVSFPGVAPAVAAALAALDDAFAPVARPAVIDCCPHCGPPGAYAHLLARPRSQLSDEDLRAYTSAVLGTVGGPADLRYFAGRILRLLHTPGTVMPDIEPFHRRLREVGWSSRPQARAVTDVFDALWQDALIADRPTAPVDALLCALGAAESTLAPRLAAWAEASTDAAVRRLHDFVIGGCRTTASGVEPRNAYRDRRSDTFAELVAWLGSGPALDAVAAAFDRTDDPSVLELLADLDGYLR
ncbi:hypothetical protein ACWEQ0_23620 [Nocardia thailandica]